MAKLNYGVFTRGRNKFGPAVTYIRGGVQVAREYVKDVRNPRTPKQMLQRTKFSELNRVSNAIKPAITIGLANVKRPDQTARNKFYQMNKGCVSGDTPSEVMFDYTQMVIADGSAVTAGFSSIKTDDALRATFKWVPNSDVPGAGAKDFVYCVAMQPDTKTAILSSGILRSAGTYDLEVPASWTGMRVHGYAFIVASEDHFEPVSGALLVAKGECSHSVYVGSGTIV